MEALSFLPISKHLIFSFKDTVSAMAERGTLAKLSCSQWDFLLSKLHYFFGWLRLTYR